MFALLTHFFHQIKFLLFHLITLIAIVSVLLGEEWIVYGYVFISLFTVAGDAWLGDDTSTPAFSSSTGLTAQLYLALPLLVILGFVFVWSVSPGDPFAFGAMLGSAVEYDFVAAKQATQTWHHVVGIFFVGQMISSIGTVTAHELVHRTWSKLAVTTGRWMLAFSFDANFSIEHVYGHHRYVATAQDPATAPRGRNVYQHILISTLKGNVSAWQIERQRLARKKLSVISVHNQCLRGYAMSALLLCAAFAIGGYIATLYFIAAGLWAKCMLEIVNYLEHYGLVREENRRVEPRHSWNTNRKISSWAMFNLSRHSHHHAHSQLPYQRLQPLPQAPTLINGYLACVFIALVPPLWKRLMAPKLAHWDNHYASPQERAILQDMKASQASRQPPLPHN